MVSPLRDRRRIIETFNFYLRNEISATKTYELALGSAGKIGLPGLLDECRRSHLERVEVLRRHIVELGGEPSTAAGTWDLIAQAEEGDPQINDKVGIAALEEFEYQDLKRYREELAKLDEEARQLMRTHVLPAQEHTYDTIRLIRHRLG